MKGNSKGSYLFSPLGAQKKDLATTSQTLLAKVKLRLRRRLLEHTHPFRLQDLQYCPKTGSKLKESWLPFLV